MAERQISRKIAFVGTSSIGKTEILSQLGKRYAGNKSYAFVPEAARVFFTENSQIPQDQRFSALVQGQVQDLQWSLERQAHESGAPNIFCDRSVLDAIAYTRAYGDRDGAEALFIKVASWLSSYHKILLLDPRDVPYRTDDIRQEDETVRMKNHQAFVDLFREKNIPYELLSGNVEQRLERVESLMK